MTGKVSAIFLMAPDKKIVLRTYGGHRTPVHTTTETLVDRWKLLSQSEGTLVPEVHIPTATVTEDVITLMQEPVMPANSTQFSALIQKIGNADWYAGSTTYTTSCVRFASSRLMSRVLRLNSVKCLMKHIRHRWIPCVR